MQNCRVDIFFDEIVKKWNFEKGQDLFKKKTQNKCDFSQHTHEYYMVIANFRIPNKLKLRDCDQIVIGCCALCIVKTSGGFEI